MAKVKGDVTVGSNPMDRKYLVKIKKIFRVRLIMLYKPNFNTLTAMFRVFNRNIVCGIISDVMTLSAKWRHFSSIVTLLTASF